MKLYQIAICKNGIPKAKEILTLPHRDNGVEIGDAILVHCVMNF